MSQVLVVALFFAKIRFPHFRTTLQSRLQRLPLPSWARAWRDTLIEMENVQSWMIWALNRKGAK